MELLTTILAFVIIIGILVAIHEFGHFMAARLSGMRVDVFAIGMGKRLFGYNKITGFTWGNLPDDWDGNGYTDYRISILPIGGYVKIAGMIDESFDTEYAQSEPKPWEFRSKNAWQKAFVITAGVIMNIVLAFGIFAGIAYINGETIYKTTTLSYVEKDSPFAAAGLESGDKVVSIDGTSVSNWRDIIRSLTTESVGDDKVITVQRETSTLTKQVSGQKIVNALTGSKRKNLGIYPDHVQVIANNVVKDNPAYKAGIRSSDILLTVDGVPIISAAQFMDIVSSRKSAPLSIRWKHDNEIKSAVVTTTSAGKVGIELGEQYTGPQLTMEYSFSEAIAVGWRETANAATSFFDMIGQIFSGKVAPGQAVGGPVKIAKMAYLTLMTSPTAFLTLMAMLSVTLAIINIMPFPALDGGHLVFIIIEGITRREVPEKIKLAFQQVGVIILLGFMVFVLYNDIAHP